MVFPGRENATILAMIPSLMIKMFTSRTARFCASFVFIATLGLSSARALVTDFSDIAFWVGSGSNQSALVIDWNDGLSPVSLAWGFRWDDSAGELTGWDMLMAIDAADSRLTIVQHPSFPAVYGIYYDLTNSGDGFTEGTPGDLGGPEDGSAANPGDHYREGWYTGYWAYSVYGGDFEYDVYDNNPPYNYLGKDTYDVAGSAAYPGANWFSAPIGAEERILANGYWDAWSFDGGAIDQPVAAAIPEPGTIGLLAVVAGLPLVNWLRRRRRA